MIKMNEDFKEHAKIGLMLTAGMGLFTTAITTGASQLTSPFNSFAENFQNAAAFGSYFSAATASMIVGGFGGYGIGKKLTSSFTKCTNVIENTGISVGLASSIGGVFASAAAAVNYFNYPSASIATNILHGLKVGGTTTAIAGASAGIIALSIYGGKKLYDTYQNWNKASPAP